MNKMNAITIRMTRFKTVLGAGKALILSALLVPAVALADQHATGSELRLAEPAAVDAVVDGFIDAGALPFLHVRIEDAAGQVIYEHGKRNEALMPYDVDGDSWIRIWSMSKIVTISLVLDLVEEGVISLDDPVTQYIPEFEGLRVAVGQNGEDLTAMAQEDRPTQCPVKTVPMERAMTVLDLINHQDGFYYPWTGLPCVDEGFRDSLLATATNSKELIDRLATLPLINQPGTDEYYGTGTTVLGLVAERATGESLSDLVAARITGPLGIEGLRYGLPEGASLPPRFSGASGSLSQAKPGELDIFGKEVPFYDAEGELFLGGEGMIGTADGYTDFIRMLLARGALNGHRFLDVATVEDIVSPHTELDSEWGHNGYNVWISNGRLAEGGQGPAPLWVGGGYEGTYYWVDPEREFVGVIMTQIHDAPEAANNSSEIIRMAIYEQLGWEEKPKVDGGP